MTRLDGIEQIVENVAKEQARLIKEQEKTDEQLRKTDEQLRRADKELSEQIKRLGKQIGDLTNGWGKFVLGLTEPGIEKCLKEIGFSLYGIVSPKERRIDNKEYEIDLLCPSSLNGKTVMIVIEAKSYVNQKKVADFIEKLKRFREFFPEYRRDIEIIGAIAGIRLASGIKELILKEGLYLFSASGEVMKNLTPAGFKPKLW